MAARTGHSTSESRSLAAQKLSWGPQCLSHALIARRVVQALAPVMMASLFARGTSSRLPPSSKQREQLRDIIQRYPRPRRGASRAKSKRNRQIADNNRRRGNEHVVAGRSYRTLAFLSPSLHLSPSHTPRNSAMPKSKRSKVYNLTKTSTKGREGKAALIDKVRPWHLCFFSLSLCRQRGKTQATLRAKPLMQQTVPRLDLCSEAALQEHTTHSSLLLSRVPFIR